VRASKCPFGKAVSAQSGTGESAAHLRRARVWQKCLIRSGPGSLRERYWD